MRLSLYILIGGFLAGVLWRSFADVGEVGVVVLAIHALVLAGVVQVRRFRAGPYVLLFAVACIAGLVRTEFAFRSYALDRAHVPAGEIQTEGVVAREPDVRDGYTVLTLALLNADGSETPVRVRAKMPTFPAYAYGERVSLSGELSVPRAFETELGRVFNYPGYLMKEGIHYELKEPVLRTSGAPVRSPLYAALLTLKHTWLASVSRLIPEPGAALAGGLVVGAKQSLGVDWLELFRITGIIHIVVLSGYNLTLIADVITRACRMFPRSVGLVLGILGIVGFALMAGASATVIRASTMAVLTLVATYVGRPRTALRLLAIAAFFMVLANPFVLVFDTGFQLSFLATLGLILFAPTFEAWCAYVPKRYALRSIVGATFATQLTVLPLLLYQVGQVSLVAPLVNVLVLPVVPFVMALTFAAGMVGMLSVAVATPIAWIAHLLLSYIFAIVELFSQLPFAAVSVPGVPWWCVVLLYVLLALVYVRYHKPHEKGRAV